jgi:hypothetical protein
MRPSQASVWICTSRLDRFTLQAGIVVAGSHPLGHPVSPYFDDPIKLWRSQPLSPVLWGPSRIEEQGETTLLLPAPDRGQQLGTWDDAGHSSPESVSCTGKALGMQSGIVAVRPVELGDAAHVRQNCFSMNTLKEVRSRIEVNLQCCPLKGDDTRAQIVGE